jgi:hypothetical protein
MCIFMCIYNLIYNRTDRNWLVPIQGYLTYKLVTRELRKHHECVMCLFHETVPIYSPMELESRIHMGSHSPKKVNHYQ